MKVLNLQCGQHHSFEGWFGSEEDFQSQLSRGLVGCPLCGDTVITKGLTAPRLNLGAQAPRAESQSGVQESGNSSNSPSSAPEGSATSAARLPALPIPSPEAQAAYLKAVRHVLANTEDVGNRFAEEARRIHYGETTERDIRGQASPEEARDLVEEGIEVGQIVLPESFKGSLQ